jgi:hypothetical protein
MPGLAVLRHKKSAASAFSSLLKECLRVAGDSTPDVLGTCRAHGGGVLALPVVEH